MVFARWQPTLIRTARSHAGAGAPGEASFRRIAWTMAPSCCWCSQAARCLRQRQPVQPISAPMSSAPLLGDLCDPPLRRSHRRHRNERSAAESALCRDLPDGRSAAAMSSPPTPLRTRSTISGGDELTLNVTLFAGISSILLVILYAYYTQAKRARDADDDLRRVQPARRDGAVARPLRPLGLRLAGQPRSSGRARCTKCWGCRRSDGRCCPSAMWRG